MSLRMSTFSLSFFCCLLLLPQKKKQVLPDFVLDAHTVLVVTYPDAGEPISNPNANRTPQENVEKALTKWGRLSLVMSAQTGDLIIAVRKGHVSGPAINNSPTDQRPVILQPADGQTRIGVQRGQPPGLTGPGPGGANERGPSVRNEIGPSEDSFEVYRGGVEYPLDASPIWRYMEKTLWTSLRSPSLRNFAKLLMSPKGRSTKAVSDGHITQNRARKTLDAGM